MYKALIIVFIFASSVLQAQNVIEWSADYKLQYSDFQSASTEIGNQSINMYTVHPGVVMGFSYLMSSYEFMATKNFNSNVTCTFNREASSLVAPNDTIAQALLNYSQYEFDLGELYARKLRKRIYEQKGAFSDSHFYEPIYDIIHKEYINEAVTTGKETELGIQKEKLTKRHSDLLFELEALSDYCKTCKPLKKKR
ncbi:MAG: hypothetical protein POELPBGB_02862 [Bacteroidia bacterium]|nr:hypothetical protein [Bacteroidia bacterium]